MVLRAMAKWNYNRKTLNFPLAALLLPNRAAAISKWPLEETGKNSVNPRTIPRMMAQKKRH